MPVGGEATQNLLTGYKLQRASAQRGRCREALAGAAIEAAPVEGRVDAPRSRHATADAIDITGFVPEDGRRVRVIDG